jgi:hypothetical protein
MRESRKVLLQAQTSKGHSKQEKVLKTVNKL